MDTQDKNWYIWQLMKACGFEEDDLKRDYFALPWTLCERLWEIAQTCGIRGNSKGWTRSRVLWYRMKKYIEDLPF